MLSKIKRFKFDYIVYLLAFVLLVAGATVLLPQITDYGMQALQMVTAVVLICYSLLYLLPKVMKKKSKLVLGFTFFEFMAMLFLGVMNILSQFKIVSINVDFINLSLGLALLLRGLSELVSDYVRREHKKPFGLFVIDLLIYSLGLYLIIKPFLGDIEFLYILIAFFYALGLLCLFLSIKFWNHKTKKAKK